MEGADRGVEPCLKSHAEILSYLPSSSRLLQIRLIFDLSKSFKTTITYFHPSVPLALRPQKAASSKHRKMVRIKSNKCVNILEANSAWWLPYITHKQLRRHPSVRLSHPLWSPHKTSRKISCRAQCLLKGHAYTGAKSEGNNPVLFSNPCYCRENKLCTANRKRLMSSEPL